MVAFGSRKYLRWFSAWLATVVAAVQALAVDAATRQRHDELRAAIAHHDELYFKQAAPEISDAAYDQLKRELRALEQAHPELATPDSMMSGDDRSGRFPTHRHRVPMLSLEKAYTEAEWRAFYADLAAQSGDRHPRVVVEPKYDGVAISLTYVRGRFERAVTRGNGREGDDVTSTVRALVSFPRELAATASDGRANPIPEFVELRGEIFVTSAEFDRINTAPRARGELPFAHPRNYAAGTLKSQDPDELSSRHLNLALYGWEAWEGAEPPASQHAFHDLVQAWGLPGVASCTSADSPDQGWGLVQDLLARRDQLGFPIDGAVVKLDDVSQRARFGESERAPRWAIACKFAPERTIAQIEAIVLQVGRTGVLTPIAEFASVDLGGVMVSRATLHNRDVIARRDIRVGDFVEIARAGDVIPAVGEVCVDQRPPDAVPFVFPERCPSCDATLVSRAEEAAVRCLNRACPAQLQRRLEHFVSKQAVGIEGCGPATIAVLVAAKRVRSPADFYRLSAKDLDGLPGIGAFSGGRLLTAIERSRRTELWRFIYGLGIPRIGPANARKLAARCEDLAAFARLPLPVIRETLGAAAAQSLIEQLALPEFRAELDGLMAAGVSPRSVPSDSASVAAR